MDRPELLARIAALKPWLAAQGVSRVRLFGSRARGAGRPDSDIDLLVDLSRPLGLAFFTLQDELSSRLGAKVDLVTEAALASDIRYTALQDAIDA
jgi:predicted nucleotidyltransferase